MQQHDRTYDHRETEDCVTVILSQAVGRYPAGSLLCDVLESLATRLRLVDTDIVHGFTKLGLDAFIAPYDPGTLGGSLLGVFGLDAMVSMPTPDSFGLDATIVAPGEQVATFGLSAYVLEPEEC